MEPTQSLLSGRYQLEELIAVGGVGQVWRAADRLLGRPVAVKLLRDEFAQHQETLDRFRAEARHAGALAHPGIAQVYDYCEPGPDSPAYLVLELVDGPSLARILDRGPLDLARTLDILAQSAAALQVAHAAGVVHRDIKPGNLLITGEGRIKITDFGIAYAAGSAPQTRTGTLLGTPAYIAPERLQGDPATPAADLYALGIIGFQCLAGGIPFTGEPLQIALAHREKPLPPLPPAVPADVAALISDLAAKDPADRPATAGEVAQRAAGLRNGLGMSTAAAAAVIGAAAGDGSAAAGWLAAGGGSNSTAMGVSDGLGPDASGPEAGTGTMTTLPGRRGKRLALAVGLPAALIAAAALLLFSLPGPSARHGAQGSASGPAPVRSSSRQSAVPVSTPQRTKAHMVNVNGAALIGQPVSTVRAELQKMGLRVAVTWVAGSRSSAGRVVSVRPTGQVPVGSLVTLTATAGATKGRGPAGLPKPHHTPGTPAPSTDPSPSPVGSSPTPTPTPTPTQTPTATPTSATGSTGAASSTT